ncbi:MAG: iron-containing alcohol dehydrogenase, partial [Bacilli bacterium]|nr:iron-containing alcohol dehydrogenase [Bacilli bacterium]
MVNRIMLNETSYFGRGSREKVAEEILNRGYQKILVVTDYNLMDNGLVKMVTDILDNNGINYCTYFH